MAQCPWFVWVGEVQITSPLEGANAMIASLVLQITFPAANDGVTPVKNRPVSALTHSRAPVFASRAYSSPSSNVGRYTRLPSVLAARTIRAAAGNAHRGAPEKRSS